MPTSVLRNTSAACHGEFCARASLFRSNACGRSGPSKFTQPVGGCLWWKNAAGPKKPSLLISRSYVPAGRAACAWRDAVPSTCGTKIGRFMSQHSSQHAPTHLVQLHRLEQRAGGAFAEPFAAPALDDLEEDRADDVLREDLQQQPFALLRIAVEQDAALAQLLEVLAVALNPRVHALIICIGRVLELHALRPQHVHRADDVRGAERD